MHNPSVLLSHDWGWIVFLGQRSRQNDGRGTCAYSFRRIIQCIMSVDWIM